MQKVLIKKVIFAGMASLMAISCQKNVDIIQTDPLENIENVTNARLENQRNSDKEMVLGKKLDNPFTVENMAKALENLNAKSGSFKSIKVTDNYLYVRVLPNTLKEFNAVNMDSTIDLFEYPLDYEIKERGNKYKDPTIKDSNYTWLYCAVPKNKKWPNGLKVETLAKLYLPNGNGNKNATESKNKGSEADKALFDALENEALTITGNKPNTKGAKIAYWYASGNIRVFDELLGGQFGGLIPLAGCKVRGNRWFSTYTTLTEDNGSFFIDNGWGNGNPVNYSIKWERNDFDIRDGLYGQAYFTGPSIVGPWSLDIQEFNTPKSYMFAHVHRAACTYYYENWRWGIKTPPQRSFFLSFFNHDRLHLGVRQGSWRSHYFSFNSIWSAAECVLEFNLDNDNSRNIFGTTIHELAHASHWEIGYTTLTYGVDALFGDPRLPESWAQGVEWRITNDVYPFNTTWVLAPNYPAYGVDEQRHTLAAIPTLQGYTPIVIDLMDDLNQSSTDPARPDDRVNGYTLGQLERALYGIPIPNWWGWRNNIRDLHNNPNEGEPLDYLFQNYY